MLRSPGAVGHRLSVLRIFFCSEHFRNFGANCVLLSLLEVGDKGMILGLSRSNWHRSICSSRHGMIKCNRNVISEMFDPSRREEF